MISNGGDRRRRSRVAKQCSHSLAGYAQHQMEVIVKIKPIFVDFRVYFCDSGH
jgi:hypothetical protein